MFCPKCKAEYRAGFTRCADCGENLVEQLPSEEPPVRDKHADNAELVQILTTSDMTDVITIKSILDSVGIEYLLRGEQMMYIDPYDPVILYVRQEEAENVMAMLKDVKLNYFRFVFNKDQYK